jgi:hypothetical protein
VEQWPGLGSSGCNTWVVGCRWVGVGVGTGVGLGVGPLWPPEPFVRRSLGTQRCSTAAGVDVDAAPWK